MPLLNGFNESQTSIGEQLNHLFSFFLACRYGELQGLNKQETADKFGAEKVKEWRRSYDIPPPNGESLEMCAERAVKYFVENVRVQNHHLPIENHLQVLS